MGRMSVATIDSPEFLNITSVNPLISKCEIKVLYVGENRNQSFISKEVAAEMAKTLPGSPIVGYYIEDKEDFLDHGEKITIDGQGIEFLDMTRPFGFVAPDAKIWFQFFDDTDEFGHTVRREYLMSEGYLWTGQYEECRRVIEQGNPQSMKLYDSEENPNLSIKGYWSTNSKTGIDFFIINDAVFQNLCILGEDVEPCFEGANITAPDVSTNFTKDSHEFRKTLYSMMNELKYALNNQEGGQEEMPIPVEDIQVQDAAVETAVVADTGENFSATSDISGEITVAENDNKIEGQEEFAKEDEELEEKKDDDSNSDSKEEDDDKKDDEDEEEKKAKANHALEEEYSKLKADYDALKVQYDELVEFKNSIDNEKKDALIDSFYMLSDEDKQEVIEKKAEYSLEEIEAKLSVICVRKKVSFAKEESETKTNLTTYNLDSVEPTENVPEWVQACRNARNNK